MTESGIFLCVFGATFEKLWLQKATFYLSEQPFWEIVGSFLRNLEQLVESPKTSLSLTTQ